VAALFEPEFLNRLDGVVHYEEISTKTAVQIVGLRLAELDAPLRSRGVAVVIGDGVAETLVQSGFDPVNGARSLGRAVRQDVIVPAAQARTTPHGRC
jgi:ATP-dependent Clp protease ATP-binding subunit ClpA